MRLSSISVLVLLVACSREKPLRVACESGDPAACEALATQYGARAAELCMKGDAASPACAAVPRSVPLDLPKASTGGELQTVMSVFLLADGKALVDDKPLPNDDAVLPIAMAAHEKNPELRAVIKADASVTHGRVIHVLDLLKQAQISKIAFGVQQTNDGAKLAK